MAASLRALEVDGVEVIDHYPASSMPPYGSGTVLAPWPNRIRDGVWVHDGVTRQLDITEVENGNAIHGLLRNRPYRVAERSEHAITLEATIFPQHGYPFLVDTSVRYELVGDGIVVTHRIANGSDAAAPVAVGAHPFLRVGDTAIADLVLTIPASTRFEVDDRLNPVAEVPVEATGFDLRAGRRVGDLDLDTAFGGVQHGGDGIARHRLSAPDGRYTEVWQGADFGFVQAFTPHTYPRPAPDAPGALGQAVAIEPMTAPPNAFNSGLGLRWLEPGQEWSGSWGVNYGRG
ncbi:aldose 1-epimerase [Cryobacterium mesophilum]|nr:aldose 1-epimerase [Terrimesophilobacter mesophilus]